eukprot:10734732-Alexandrium_andersonii.AAC.1
MSASLVGSEMCIRDRTLFLRSSLGGFKVPHAESCGHPMLPCRSVGPGGCLLYTSDAADDM